MIKITKRQEYVNDEPGEVRYEISRTDYPDWKLVWWHEDGVRYLIPTPELKQLKEELAKIKEI